MQVIGIGKGCTTPHQVMEVVFPGQEGKPISFRAHSVPELNIDVAMHDAEEIGKIFPHIVKECVSLPTGTVHALLDSDDIQLMPRELERRDRLILYKSMFSGGPDLVVAGLTGDPIPVVFAFATKMSHFAPVNFLSEEALGTDLPRRCRACKACKECCSRQRKMLSMI